MRRVETCKYRVEFLFWRTKWTKVNSSISSIESVCVGIQGWRWRWNQGIHEIDVVGNVKNVKNNVENN